ncbi:hypothetical protein Tco_0387375 [Tanacetum coccineum]
MSKTHAPLWWLPWGDDGVDRGGSSGCDDDDDDDVKMVVGASCGGDRGGGGSAWRRVSQTTLGLAIPEQTATGKESSNPFMAGDLPKTIHFCDSLQSDEDSFELIKLMILCTNFLTMVRDLENSKTFQLLQKDFLRMHPNRGGFMMHMQWLQRSKRWMMTRFQTAIRSEEVFGYILLVIKKLTLKKLDD